MIDDGHGPVRRLGSAEVGRWHVEHLAGSALALHALRPPPSLPAASRLDAIGPAMVLGSAQKTLAPDARLDGVEVVVRRSGGGAVHLAPGAVLWIDLWIGRDDPLWDDDVGRSFLWLGSLWAAALDRFDIRATVHEGPPDRREEGKVVCFAGIGSGELTVGGHKAIGLSQRRTRYGARFQSAAMLDWDLAPYVAALGPAAAAALAAPAARPAALGLDPSALADAVLAELAGR